MMLRRLCKRHLSTSGNGAFPLLFTPGPLTTSKAVKEATLVDLGSRDPRFSQVHEGISSSLLRVANVPHSTHVCIPIQGSGTFAVEACVQTTVPRRGKSLVSNNKNGENNNSNNNGESNNNGNNNNNGEFEENVLVISNGAYGERIAKICEAVGLRHELIRHEWDERINVKTVKSALSKERAIKFSNLFIVHHETTSGILNPVREVVDLVKQYSPSTVIGVDAMSSFGAIPLSMDGIHFLISSANKCIAGIPGFAFVIANKEALAKCKGNARSLALDLYDQHESLSKTRQFRFTPPTHSMLAFKKALEELDDEGGVAARGRRFEENQQIIAKGMAALGLKPYISEDLQGPIITMFPYPAHPNFTFERFYEELVVKGYAIYAGKIPGMNCFRVGNIGELYPHHCKGFVKAVEQVLLAMNIPVPCY